MLEINGLTMKHGIEASKKPFEKLNQRQKKQVLEIMGGKTWFVKDGMLWIFWYRENGFGIIPWKFSRESYKIYSKETEKELSKIWDKLARV